MEALTIIISKTDVSFFIVKLNKNIENSIKKIETASLILSIFGFQLLFSLQKKAKINF
jgi:hypothetical protein